MDLNPRPQPWQGCALPLSYARLNLPYKYLNLSKQEINLFLVI